MTQEDAEIVIPAIIEALLPVIRQEIAQTSPQGALPEAQLRQLVDAVLERVEAVYLAGFVTKPELENRLQQLETRLSLRIDQGRQQAPDDGDGLPVGGERVVKHLIDADPNLTREEAVARVRQAFQATASDSPDEAIAWLDESLAEEILPADETELDETISQLLGYESFHRAPRRQYREIRQLASVFSQREDSRRTLDELQAAIGEAVEAGQLSPKKS